jgi:6-pyruvoyltetrahydropterin/6-carboxytetrahydropterin synthase
MASPRYTLRVIADFASAHTLRDYPGPCSRMHGHNWKVEVEVDAAELDSTGMGLDFKVIKQSARNLVNELDHRYLNDVPPFDTVNPTAENIAAHLYRELSQRLNDDRVRVRAVTLWETERACVRYTEVRTA